MVRGDGKRVNSLPSAADGSTLILKLLTKIKMSQKRDLRVYILVEGKLLVVGVWFHMQIIFF